jgi:hypothetical protein
LLQQDHAKEGELMQRYEQTITKLNDSYVQRAKKNWVKDGDRNTAYFHRSIAKRRRRNTIVSIKDEQNAMHFMPDQIAKVFSTYFRSIFQSQRATNASSSSDPFLYNISQPIPDDLTYSVPDKTEIWHVLNDMKRNSSPGPDGFNVEFYLSTWAWIGDDVLKLVKDFFTSGALPPQASDTHIVLIPKKTGASGAS